MRILRCFLASDLHGQRDRYRTTPFDADDIRSRTIADDLAAMAQGVDGENLDEAMRELL